MVRLFRHYIPRSLFILCLVEALVFVFSVTIGFSVRFGSAQSEVNQFNFAQALLFAGVMLSAMTAMGLYQREIHGGVRGTMLRIVIGFVAALAMMSVLFYLFPDLFLGRGVIAVAVSSAFLGVVVSRLIFFLYADKDILNRRVLVVGAGKRAAAIGELAKKRHLKGVRVVGFWSVDDESRAAEQKHLFSVDRALVHAVKENQIDEIVVAIDDRRKTFPTEALLACKMSGVEVIDSVTFLERQTGKIDVEGLHPSSLIFADGYVHTVLKPGSKRVFDLLAASAILLLTWPIMVVTALVIWLESGCRGTIFYKQVRVGAGGKLFEILKFRSMVENAEKNGAQWAAKNDPRVTKVGNFIRKTRIDELPQLMNVLKGDMSFVGPRPERPKFVDELSASIPYYNLRHGLKPGITGWAQVCYAYGASEEDAVQKLQYDLYYMKNYSIFLDLMVLFQTADVVLWQKGSR